MASDTLAIKGLGLFERFKAATAFRQLIESWHVSDFHLSAARGRKEASGESEHLSETGDNLPLVSRLLHEQHPKTFASILATMAARVPGVKTVEPRLMDDGYLTLRFQDGSFKTPFLDRYVSDGTIKMFAYLVLLHDPRPHPLLCVEEAENQLYPTLMVELAEEFRLYANRGGQVLVSTHSPDFLNAATLDEVCWLVNKEGATGIRRARDQRITVRTISFEGKQDLEKQLVRRLRGYRNPQARFLVMRDLDSAPDCAKVKRKLIDLCRAAGKESVSLVRIACRELESIYLAGLSAVERAFGQTGIAVQQSLRKFRRPDGLGSPSAELSRLTGGVYQETSGSHALGSQLDLDNERSPTFKHLIGGIRQLESELLGL